MCLENGGGAGTHTSRTTNMRPGRGPWRRAGEEEASFLRIQEFVVSWANDRAAWDLMGLEEGISGGRNNERQA